MLMVVKIFAMVWVIRQTDDINVFEEDTTFIFRRPLMMEDGWWSLTLPTVLPMSVVHGSTISPYEQCITETHGSVLAYEIVCYTIRGRTVRGFNE